MRLGAGLRIRDNWLMVGEGYLQSKLEPGADIGDSLKDGFLLGIGHRRSSGLEALLGVELGTRLDHDGLYAWPSLRVRWRIDDRWRLEFNNGGLGVVCEISERWRSAPRPDSKRIASGSLTAATARPASAKDRSFTGARP